MAEILERAARIASRGRVTIPADIRRGLGVRGGGSLIFRSRGGVVTVSAARKPTLADLLAGFDPVAHRHGPEERTWDDDSRRRESI